MKLRLNMIAMAAALLPVLAAAQGDSTTQAPGTPAGGQMSTRSTATVDKVKADHKVRKSRRAAAKETAPGDVAKTPPSATSSSAPK